MVEYSSGYLADHWWAKGPLLLCLAGELETELSDGRKFTLTPGMSYQVGDGDPPRPKSRFLTIVLFGMTNPIEYWNKMR